MEKMKRIILRRQNPQYRVLVKIGLESYYEIKMDNTQAAHQASSLGRGCSQKQKTRREGLEDTITSILTHSARGLSARHSGQIL